MPVNGPLKKQDSVFGQLRRQPKAFRAGLYPRVSVQNQETLTLQSSDIRENAAQRR